MFLTEGLGDHVTGAPDRWWSRAGPRWLPAAARRLTVRLVAFLGVPRWLPRRLTGMLAGVAWRVVGLDAGEFRWP